MAKRGSTVSSSTTVAKKNMVMGDALERILELEKEVSRLRHHVSVLSRRNHALVSGSARVEEKEEVGKEEVAVEVASPCEGKEPEPYEAEPLQLVREVAVEVAPPGVAQGPKVVAEAVADPGKAGTSVADRMDLGADSASVKRRRLGSEADEDVVEVVGGRVVILAPSGPKAMMGGKELSFPGRGKTTGYWKPDSIGGRFPGGTVPGRGRGRGGRWMG